VVDGRRIVAKQREHIGRLRELRCSTLDAEDTLEVFLSTLEIFEGGERLSRSGFSQKAPLLT
jgi:hypothetical protein